jgi:F0F1-type ATP synthase assembly protein I
LRLLRRPPQEYVVFGAALGVLAFLAHGLLDSFLAFTPTALLVWLLLGMLAQKPQVSGR